MRLRGPRMRAGKPWRKRTKEERRAQRILNQAWRRWKRMGLFR